MGNEYLTYRFGFMAVKKGFAAPEQVSKALEVQFDENIAAKQHRLVGEIEVHMGCKDTYQVNKVLESMLEKPLPL